MSKNYSDSFEALGAPVEAPRSDWSSVSSDGDVVIITVWRDELDYSDRSAPVLDCRNHPDIDTWSTFPGNRKRKRHIEHALEKCGGRFKVVLCEAKDVNALPREIKRAWPWEGVVGEVTDFDQATGGFRAVFRSAGET